jgi:NDP-sugar pyrophosphorylase family protein
MLVKAIILAGGYGKRLRPITTERPKTLIEIGSKPILEIQFEWLKKFGINEIILCVGHLKEKVIEYVGNGSRFNLRVGYAVEEEPLGTAGALKNSEILIRGEEKCIMLNGDIITDLDLSKLIQSLGKNVGVISLVHLRSPYGVVECNNKGEITDFKEKPFLEDHWINAGVYCFSQEIFKYLPEKGNIEITAFPKLAKKKKLKGVRYSNCYWRSIDVQKDIEETKKELKERKILK